MKAARIPQYRQPLSLDDLPIPKPGPGEILVHVEGAGFCHSDIHVLDGEIQILPRLPMVLGHENAGPSLPWVRVWWACVTVIPSRYSARLGVRPM